ncbi:hypothetical protein HYO65_gp096 [Tenacibaculum phage PTm1]|uniref:Uncharacterized protein n=2 Tax=Shirahamavirus PTm1 TaxID=2846435 RepID=A0A5S9HXH6_9CAUD|nr:hypothetical protein HYO65_gp096 [Tenacibaculum phage PTm1]BBI90488.1 hypothetical protein [Tenacibaculum phage PTm1]BBI90796.1 hypothetical protein [Tenacibaculum phage PTm5]
MYTYILECSTGTCAKSHSEWIEVIETPLTKDDIEFMILESKDDCGDYKVFGSYFNYYQLFTLHGWLLKRKRSITDINQLRNED